jgi:hypothetical protein
LKVHHLNLLTYKVSKFNLYTASLTADNSAETREKYMLLYLQYIQYNTYFIFLYNLAVKF